MNEVKFAKNGAEMPYVAMRNPPITGPIARLILINTPFKAMAEDSSFFWTIDGSSDSQAGAIKALPVPSKNVNNNINSGVAKPFKTMTAKHNAASAINRLASSMMRRRLKISANAPASSANSKMGMVVAVCTKDTIKGDGDNCAINQAVPTDWIQVPMVENKSASQSTVNI